MLSPVGPEDEPLYEPGRTATVLGWGLTSQNGTKGSDRLRRVDVPVVSDADCGLAYEGNEPPFRPKREICAGAAGRDACGGDSGGPLVVADGAGGLKQVGVVSSGRGCGLARFPGIYGEVPARLDFITDRAADLGSGAGAAPAGQGTSAGRRPAALLGRPLGGEADRVPLLLVLAAHRAAPRRGPDLRPRRGGRRQAACSASSSR